MTSPHPTLSSIFVQKRGWKEGASEQPLPRALLAMCHSPFQRGEGGAVYLGAGEQGTESLFYYG